MHIISFFNLMHNIPKFRKCFSHALTSFSCFLRFLYFLSSSNICRIFSWKCKFCKSKRIWSEWWCFTWRNKFISCCYRIMYLWYNLNNKIFWKGHHLRPVLNIRAKLDFLIRICYTLAVKYSVCVNILVKMICRTCKFNINICSRCKISFICRCCCNRTSIHKCNRCNLTFLKLWTFSVREVSCWMSDWKCIISRCISGTKTRTTECSLNYSTCLHKISKSSISCKFHINWRTCRIYT